MPDDLSAQCSEQIRVEVFSMFFSGPFRIRGDEGAHMFTPDTVEQIREFARFRAAQHVGRGTIEPSGLPLARPRHTFQP
jgi:hypothetical protein